jgi:hypothetical protein
VDIAQQSLTFDDTQIVAIPQLAVILSYYFNLPAAITNGQPVLLDVDTLALIFSGRITSWLHPAITTLNPSFTAAAFNASKLLPTITVVVCCSDPAADTRITALMMNTMNVSLSSIATDATKRELPNGLFTYPYSWTPVTS